MQTYINVCVYMIDILNIKKNIIVAQCFVTGSFLQIFVLNMLVQIHYLLLVIPWLIRVLNFLASTLEIVNKQFVHYSIEQEHVRRVLYSLMRLVVLFLFP